MNKRKAMKYYYKQAAELGYASGLAEVTTMHLFNVMLKKVPEKEWIKGMQNVTSLCLSSVKMKKKGFNIYIAAYQGHQKSMHTLATLHNNGSTRKK